MFAYHFILIFSAILIAVNAASLGSFLVLNKMSMLIDAIAHAILPAIVISFVLFNFRYYR
jgi:ABC-type Mn2+/Zn2+ transport system permease subunit